MHLKLQSDRMKSVPVHMFWRLMQQSVILPNKLLPDTLRTWHIHDHFLTPALINTNKLLLL